MTGRRRAVPTFAECEASWAGPTSPQHLRRVEPGERLRTGGSTVPLHPLCGVELPSGSWDLYLFDPATADRAAAVPAGTPGTMCRGCMAAYREVTS